MTANERQVGGDHYKTSSGYQHWDLIEENNIGYCESMAIKYVTRWRRKNGLQDLEKAEHYIEKLQELGRGPRGGCLGGVVKRYCVDNRLTQEESDVVFLLCTWSLPSDLGMALSKLRSMIRLELENGRRKEAVPGLG